VNAPKPVVVEMDGNGQLKAVARGDHLTHIPHPTPHAIASILDSWQLDDEWWRQRISRRYVEVMLEGGKRALLFEDLVTGEWFEQTP
jgi:hypothetical protein